MASRRPPSNADRQQRRLDWHGGYEYHLTVAAASVPAVLAARGGSPGDDPLPLFLGQAEPIVIGGESRWLRAHGIPFDLGTW